ncbi:MAG: hypothetical protein K8R59_02800 [Thermoanaerobaculales bacterium]|nr:hypothetical protein [Thermoanaerobaculales bacterium]
MSDRSFFSSDRDPPGSGYLGRRRVFREIRLGGRDGQGSHQYATGAFVGMVLLSPGLLECLTAFQRRMSSGVTTMKRRSDCDHAAHASGGLPACRENHDRVALPEDFPPTHPSQTRRPLRSLPPPAPAGCHP